MEKYTEKRPWGDFERFTLNEVSTVKIITVKKDEAFSLQYHNKRSEFWKVLKGQGLVTIGDETRETIEGEEIFIPQNTNHRMQGITDISFLEIALGEFDENDIVRLEDKYGRN